MDNRIYYKRSWQKSTDGLGKFYTYISEIKLEFKSKDLAIKYAKKNNINFEIIEPKKKNHKKIIC